MEFLEDITDQIYHYNNITVAITTANYTSKTITVKNDNIMKFCLLLNTTIDCVTDSLGYKCKRWTVTKLALALMLTIGAHILRFDFLKLLALGKVWDKAHCSSQLDAPSIRGVGNQKRPVGMCYSRRTSGQPTGGDAASAIRLKLAPWPATAVQLVRYWPVQYNSIQTTLRPRFLFD